MALNCAPNIAVSRFWVSDFPEPAGPAIANNCDAFHLRSRKELQCVFQPTVEVWALVEFTVNEHATEQGFQRTPFTSFGVMNFGESVTRI